MNISIIKKPSAWFPVATSLAVFAIMIISFSMSGVPSSQPDEGTGAHLFQIWLILEVFMVLFFAIKWLPKQPKQALIVTAFQILSAALPMAIVYFLKL